MFRSVRSRIVVMFAAAFLVILGVAGVTSYIYVYQYEHAMTDRMAWAALTSSDAIMEAVAANNAELTPDMADYNEYREMLRAACKGCDADYIYAFRYDRERKITTYIMIVAEDDEADAQIAESFPIGQELTVTMDEQELRALSGEDVTEALVTDNDYGLMLSWFEDVSGWDDVLVGVDFSVQAQRGRVMRTYLMVIVPLIVTFVVFLAVGLLALRKHVFAPIQMISQRMAAFEPGKAQDFEPLGIDSPDELGEIATEFEDMATSINTYLDNIERMTKERVQTEVELDVARRIQMGIVPVNTDLHEDGFEAHGFTRPARAVGGDFYDVLTLDDGRLAAVVGDVSGKGVAAALFMATTKALIRNRLQEDGDPVEVLLTVNERLCEINPEGMFASVFVCVLDPATGEVRYANAGHTPPVLLGREFGFLEMDPGDLLGLFDDARVGEGVVALDDGEGMLVYTDGATEAVGPGRQFFGDAALLECLAQGAPFQCAADAVDTLVASVETFAGDCEQSDDLTIVAFIKSKPTTRTTAIRTNI